MKKVISFSLWGDNPKYTIGAIRNAELTPIIYPGWISRFYCGESVPTDIIKTLISLPNTEVIMMDVDGDWTGMFWRFYACEDSDIMLSRDTDSRLSLREKLAVDEWLSSDKDFHIMRDHPYHNTEILGGMWGVRNGLLKNMKQLINDYTKGDFWQVDQNFLREKIYPLVVNNSFTHDTYFNYNTNSKQFPSKSINKEFVGDVFDENENRHPEYYKFIKE
jgi:hypothetical protein